MIWFDGLFSTTPNILATVAAGIFGAYVAKRVKLPAPFMTGSLFAVLALGLLTGRAYFPGTARPFIQIVAGGSIGANIDRQTISDLRRIGLPVAIYVVSLLIISLCAAAVVALLTPLSPVTALLSCAPGGVVDMSILSYDFGGNPSHVSVLQIMRLIVGIGIFPSLTQVYLKRFGKPSDYDHLAPPPKRRTDHLSFKNSTLPSIFLLTAGGALGYWSGLPAGTLTFAMAAAAVFQYRTSRLIPLANIKKYTQIAAGAIIGSTMTLNDLLSLVHLLLPFCIILAEYLLINYGIGPLIARVFKIDLATMLLACTPAGVSDMALIAGEMGGNQAKVAVFQIARLISTLIVFPFVVRLLPVLGIS